MTKPHAKINKGYFGKSRNGCVYNLKPLKKIPLNSHIYNEILPKTDNINWSRELCIALKKMANEYVNRIM